MSMDKVASPRFSTRIGNLDPERHVTVCGTTCSARRKSTFGFITAIACLSMEPDQGRFAN
ncbi:hypothetical protein RhiXN_11602 [Rhizoctonia solani]|uniref:Uncharacterized protein n=1 Tax=Rhizoctonia solani TaxID=456999 RepID=A0A8H8P572_9AGAM|nr:uncharacterized protein RhiXN_11602 [Rhizoctonia solani]QRW24690.1 hypothetical protein RhiXN_11602 [Rhizoctonia solani]